MTTEEAVALRQAKGSSVRPNVMVGEEDMGNVEKRIFERNYARGKALREIMRLRKRFDDAAEFGRQAASVIDCLISDEAADGPIEQRHGAWNDDERDVLRCAANNCADHYAAIAEAVRKLNRSKSQITSMGRNMGLW